MMNRSTSSSGEASTFVPSSMSFAGVGGSSSQQTPKQQHFWEWETSSCSHITGAAAASNNNRSSFFPSAAAAAVPFQHFDHYFPAPPLLPINPYFASPASLAADYPISLIKSELDVELGGGGAIGLNLGHRTYFSSSNSSDQGFFVDRLFAGSSSSSSIRALQFQYPMFSGGQPPARCQAEGCKADLFRAKHYHRRHKVCEFHSKATLALVAGLQQRFCQQCSRFHVLAEFDEAKRSCRKRLADHNRRRRKLPLTTTTSAAATVTTTAVDVDDSSIKPKPPQNSTGCNKDRTSMRGPAAGFCVDGGVEVDKGWAGGNAAAAAMYAKEARGGMAIDDSLSVGVEKKAQQQRHCCCSSSSSSRPVVGNSSCCTCSFHSHNFFSHETGAGGGAAGQSSTAAASEERQQQPQQSHLFQLGQAFFEVDYI